MSGFSVVPTKKRPWEVRTSERRVMRELFVAGQTRRAISKVTRRHVDTVAIHIKEIANWMPRRAINRRRISNAKRIERLFASCNRALAEAAR